MTGEPLSEEDLSEVIRIPKRAVSFSVSFDAVDFDPELWFLLTNTRPEPLSLTDPELYARLTCEGSLA